MPQTYAYRPSTRKHNGPQATTTQRGHPTRPARMPASWRRLAQRPRNPVTGLSMYGPWSSLRPYALKLLRHDQVRIRRTLRDLGQGTGGERRSHLARCEAEIAVYARVSLEVFYPAYLANCRKAEQRAIYHECMELHRAIELHLSDLRRSRLESAQFAGRARALRLAVRDLFRLERGELFLAARRVLGRRNLKALGRAMQDHRRAVLRNPGLAPRQA